MSAPKITTRTSHTPAAGSVGYTRPSAWSAATCTTVATIELLTQPLVDAQEPPPATRTSLCPHVRRGARTVYGLIFDIYVKISASIEAGSAVTLPTGARRTARRHHLPSSASAATCPTSTSACTTSLSPCWTSRWPTSSASRNLEARRYLCHDCERRFYALRGHSWFDGLRDLCRRCNAGGAIVDVSGSRSAKAFVTARHL